MIEINIFVVLKKKYHFKNTFFLLCSLFIALTTNAQGNRLSFIINGPKNLSICGVNDSAFIEVYNISSGPVNSITVKLILPLGINYVKGTFNGTGISETNITNLNQPIFSLPNLGLAKNTKFRVLLTADCNLLTFLNSSSTPTVSLRADYTGNFDVGSSIPYSVRVPSVQYGTVTNLSYTGDVSTKFARSVTIGNYGKGPLREIRLTRYNGKDVQTFYVSKGNTVYKGDTVITIFNTSHFKTIGNLDTFLDQNETITFIDSNLIKGCKLLSTNFELSWGCGGKSCQVSKLSGSALISNKTPTLKAIPLPVYPTCYNNNTFKSEVRFVNTGNMPAVSPRLAISSNYAYMFSSFDTGSIRMKVGYKGNWYRPVKDSTTGSYNAGYYGCIGLYPIGLFRVKCPDLKPNDTVYLTWNTTSCTPPPCSNASMVVNSWAYYADYKDQCKNLKTLPWTWGKVYDQHYFTGSIFSPTDLVNNQIGEFRTYINSASLLNRSSSASYVVDLILPKGLVHSKQKKDFYFINSDLTAYWNPDSIVQRGDTIKAYFPHPVPISLTGAELVYYLKADCSKSGSNGMQSITTQIKYIPDKSCGSKEWIYLYCQTQQLKIHCISNCAGGMKFRNFKVQRVTFGRPDNDNDGKPDVSGSLDTLRVREERCFVGDTIQAEYFGVVKRTSSIITWRNAYIESTITNGKNLDVAGIQLLVWRRGVTLSLNCNQIKSWKTVTGANATFKIDLSTDSMSNCVSSGFRYSNDDSLVVKVKYRVNGNLGGTIQNMNFSNRFYTSNVNNPTSNANKFQCDTFSGQMILTGYFFTTCCSDNYQLNSCATISVNNYFYLGIGGNSYGGNNYFPYEYRNFAKIKAIRYYMPAGMKLKNAYMAQYRTSGSNKTTLETKDSLRPVNINANPMVFEVGKYFKDSTGGVINLSDDGFHGYFVAQMDPTCEIQSGTPSLIKYDFIFERKGTLGSKLDTVSSGFTDKLTYNKPVFTVKPVSPTIYAAQDTADWELVFTNYSSSFSNTNTWFSPDNSGAIKVVQIRDGGTKDTLMPSKNGVYKLGTIPFNTTRKFKVRAIYNSCKKDSIILYAGWNCAGYPNDLASYPCVKERIPLYLEPQNTQYQVSLTDSIRVADLCASTPYTMTIENIGATAGYATKAIINLPIGMTVEPGSCFIRYPHKSSKASLSNPILKSGTTYEWNLAGLNTSIANGFKGVSDTNKNKIVIYFRVKTSCDYSSGNYIRASASGNIRCGDPIMVYPAISNPLNIKGVTRPYYTLLKVESDTIFPCEKPSKVRVKIINLGPGKTGKEDKYQAILLPGMSYNPSLYTARYNAPNDSLTTSRNINGATEVEFSLRDSIQPGDSMYFDFGFNSNGRYLNCGTVDLYSQAAVKQEVTCVSNNTKCKINVVTGNNLQKPIVVKGAVGFLGLKSKILSTDSDSETIVLQYRIINSGSKIAAPNSIVYKIVYDNNGSGTVNAGDLTAMTDTLKSGLAKGGFLDVSKTLKVKAGQSCALYIALDSASCSCGFTYARFPVPGLQNAGVDRSICSGDTVKLGTLKVNNYRYLWTPGSEFASDTVAQPFAVIENTDSIGIFKTYILTTYRGFCSSKDTVKVEVYKLPELRLIQRDTALCKGNQVILSASSKGGTGKHSIQWTPSAAVKDSVQFSTVSRIYQSLTIRAVITDTKQCQAKDSLRISIHDNPIANFGYPETCEGLPLTLTDSSSIKGDSIVQKKWTYNGYDTMQIKQWTIDLMGNMDAPVRLYVRSNFGCDDTLQKSVYLNPYVIAGFAKQDVCFGDSISLRDSSKLVKGNISSLIWDLGDGNTASGSAIKHRYNSADTYQIQLVAISDKNCNDTIGQSVIVYPRPKADFSIGSVCLKDSVHTINTSTVVNDSIRQYQWILLQDTATDYQFNYLPKLDTLYNLSLKVKTEFGCADSITKTFEAYTNPVAQFNVAPVCEGNSSTFISSSSISKGSISSYQYRLSDGYNYNTQNFIHQFSKGDTFDVELVVNSNHNCRDTITKQAIVYSGIQPSFSTTDTCVSGVVVFKDQSKYINTGISTWKYYFGNGDSSGTANPYYQYNKAGKYTIKQVVVSKEGCSYDTFGTVDIFPLPVPDFRDTNQCVDNQFKFFSRSSISSGSIQNYLWKFSDATTSVLKDPPHVFPGAGNYTVKLIVESDKKCLDSTEQTVTSYPPVVVRFGAYNVCLGDPIEFSDSSIVPSSTVMSYRWWFGDGDSSDLSQPLHTYQKDGTYPVKLRITTAYNCDYDTTGGVTVYPVPVAGFKTDPDQGTIVNPEIQISDLSIGADTVLYDLGDGTFSSMRNLANNYPDSGVFKLSQTAWNIYGCRDTFYKTISIRYLFVFNTPTAFSPNHDGINDVFAPGGIGYGKYSMWIYNRWGELIYQTDEGKGWDGTYAGEPVMTDVYAVRYKVKDFKGRNHYYSATFTLLR